MGNNEYTFLKSWKVKLGLLTAIIIPTITATGAFYDLKASILEKEQAVNARISAVELQTEKNFADKTALQDMRNDIKEIRGEVSEIKTILIRKTR